jgi:integrase
MREVNDRTDVLSHRVAEEHGHASITVTAHVYADLYDDELDDVASALDALDDRPPSKQKVWAIRPYGCRREWALICDDLSGQGRDRTGDLPLFRRTLVPTELPGRKALGSTKVPHHKNGDPDGTRTRDLRRDRAAR